MKVTNINTAKHVIKADINKNFRDFFKTHKIVHTDQPTQPSIFNKNIGGGIIQFVEKEKE